MDVLAAHTGLQVQSVAVENSYVRLQNQTEIYLSSLSTRPLGCYMHFIQPMHLQDCVSQHHQVACGETYHTGYPVPWGFPLGCWRGVIMEGDHDLSLQIYRINHNCNCEISGSYMLQLASAALSIPSSTPLQ